jgi:hypothetical protein
MPRIIRLRCSILLTVHNFERSEDVQDDNERNGDSSCKVEDPYGASPVIEQNCTVKFSR